MFTICFKYFIALNFAIALPPFIFSLLLAKYLIVLKGIIILLVIPLVIPLVIIKIVFLSYFTFRKILSLCYVQFDFIVLIYIFNKNVKSSFKLIVLMWFILILLPVDFALPIAPLFPVLAMYYKTTEYRYLIREHFFWSTVFLLIMLFMIFLVGPISISHRPINTSILDIILKSIFVYVLEPIFGYVLEPILRLLLFIISLILEPIIKLFKIIYTLWCWIGYSISLGYLKYLMFLGNELKEYFLPLIFSHNKTKWSPLISSSIFKDSAFNSGECRITHIKLARVGFSPAVIFLYKKTQGESQSQKKKGFFLGVALKDPISSLSRLIKRPYSTSSHLSDGNFTANQNKLTPTSQIENYYSKTQSTRLNFKVTTQIQSFEQYNKIKAKIELSKARKYFPSATKEWYNSQYTYNTLEMRSILGLYFTYTKFIKTYFNSRPYRKKKQMNARRRLYMINKLYISKPELKHTSNKVTTTLYIFAEKYFNLTYLYRFLNKENFDDFSQLQIGWDNLLNLKKSMDNDYIKPNKIRTDKFPKLEINLGKMSQFLENKLSLSYRKKHEIRLVRLKYLYLNNYMLSEYIALKLISKKRNLYRAKKFLFRKIKFPHLNKQNKDQFRVAKKNIILKSLQNKTRVNRGKIIWNEWRKNEYFRPDINLPYNIAKVKDSYKDFLNNIKYKFPVGIRLGIAGRLTKRNRASRSLKKFTYIGSIKDIDSSYKKLSVPILRGYLKTSLDYAKFHSLAQTGAFTVKSWLSKNY